MQTNTLIQIVRCPNCGSAAIRHCYSYSDKSISNSRFDEPVIHTECPTCDYLMKMRSIDGSVVEAYAPSTNPVNFQKR